MRIFELGAQEMLDRLDEGELSSSEIVEALLARVDAVNGPVNAIVHRFDEEAMARARRADEARSRGERWGPLHGLPITVKESVETRGVASTLGLRSREDRVAADDAVVVRAALDAGAIVLGKTNVPQTLASPIHTVNPIWGRTSNPWKPTHASGGSSGGEAAALASGMSVLGIGSDIGGSIRVPASFCGVCGLKPTTRVWSNLGSENLLEGIGIAHSQTGPMARSSDDLASMFDALTGPFQTQLDPVVPPLSGSDGPRRMNDLRVGCYENDGFLAPAASVARAVREAAGALEERGVEVVSYRPPAPGEVPYLMFEAAMADGGETLREAVAGDDLIGSVQEPLRMARLPGPVLTIMAGALRLRGERRVARLVESLRTRTGGQYRQLLRRVEALRREELHRWQELELDAVLCPAFPTPAAPHGVAEDFTIAFSYTVRFNLTDMPAGVVPVTRVTASETSTRPEPEDRLDERAAEIEAASEGLPVGVQVVGRPWRERLILQLMRAIEEDVRRKEDHPRAPVTPRSPGT